MREIEHIKGVAIGQINRAHQSDNDRNGAYGSGNNGLRARFKLFVGNFRPFYYILFSDG